MWLDEGIAAQMEGMTRDDAIDQNEEDESGAGGRGRGGGVVFQPEANTDRLGQLHEALAADRLPDLATLLATRPNSLLGDSDELVLDYYAQVWAFSRFLAEFDNGRYAQRLALLLRDARHGQMKARVEATLVKNGLPIEQESTGLMNPTAVFRVYFAANLDVVDAQFGEFKSQLAAQWESVLQQTGQRRNSGRHPRKWRGQYAK